MVHVTSHADISKVPIVFGDDSTVLSKGDITEKRVVAFMDIMGFKDRVARMSSLQIKEQLDNLAYYMSEVSGGMEHIDYTMFSDSIILYTDLVDKEGFSSFSEFLSSVFRKSISLQIPIKGAIALGEFTADKSKNIYFGQPLIDAYLLEEDIVCYDIAVHHTLEKNVKELENIELYSDYKLPLKQGTSKHYLLNCFKNDTNKSLEDLQRIRENVSDSPRRYIDNTETIIKEYMHHG